MTRWLPDPAGLHRPVYLSLAGQIARAIADGTLRAGCPMPTHRELAGRLAISVQTVSRAYAELIRQGLLVAEVGCGTFVRPLKAEPAPPFIPERIPEIVDLSILKPVSEALHLGRMQAALAALAADLPASVALSFRPNIALARHRTVAVGWLRHCGLETMAKNVLVTNGATPGMSIALMTAARTGGCVLTEEIGHHTLVPLCSYLGLRLAGLAIDHEGVLPDAFERACRNSEVSALFVHPNAASPTSALMGAARRGDLVELARRYQVQIIENDTCGPLIESGLPPLAALAPERTLYVTSLTKCVMPGLRTGFLVVPDPLVPAAANRQLVTSWMATALLAEIAARWIEDGTALSLVRWQRNALRRRQKIAAEILRDLPYSAHPGGLQVWLRLPAGVREDQFVAQARLHGVGLAPGASFATSPDPGWPAVRIAIGATSEAELRVGLGIVADLHRSRPEPPLLAI
jgi:DNA-binding transcriptional MocR family regulator